MSRLEERLWDPGDPGVLMRLLLSPLWLLSLLYGVLVRRRVRRAQRPGRVRRIEAKVISVGNLTAGGAGKTPVTIYLARRLLAAGQKPFVLSRGYGRAHPSRDLVVSDGTQIQVEVREAGDEPLLIARSCPGAAVVVSRYRADAAQAAVREYGARLFLLDDGFQHLALWRDLDIVVLDASNPFGNGYLLPRGPLREGRASLARAGLVWLSKIDQAMPDEIAALEAEVRRHTSAPVVQAAWRVADVLDDAGQSLGPRALAGKRVMMLSGIGRPASFRRTLCAIGATIEVERNYPDHHWFTPMEVEDAKLRARRLEVDAIAMTEKDAVRLPDSARKGRFAVVRIEVEVRSGEQAVAAALAGP
jgi:tetraacyldisaccharide 4'-kinase